MNRNQHVETVSRPLGVANDAPMFRVAHGTTDGEFQFAALQRDGKSIYLDKSELVALIETVFITVPDIREQFFEAFYKEYIEIGEQ